MKLTHRVQLASQFFVNHPLGSVKKKRIKISYCFVVLYLCLKYSYKYFPRNTSNSFQFPNSNHKGLSCLPDLIMAIITYHIESEVKVKSLSCARLFGTPRTVACTKLLYPWDFPSKSTGVGCHSLLRGIFPTQGSNPGLLNLLLCCHIFYHLSYEGFILQRFPFDLYMVCSPHP